MQPWCTPFWIWNESVVPCRFNCCFLTWIQISQEAGQVVWYSHLFKRIFQFVAIHTVKGFDIVNKAEVDVFLELSRFFNDTTDVGNFVSGFSAFSKSTLNIWKFMLHVLLKPGLENLSNTLLACDYHSNEISHCDYHSVRWVQLCDSLSFLWHCFSLGLEWKLTFSSPVATAEFFKFAGIMSAALSQHHLLGFEIAQLGFHHLH